jgi:hypothetical protein
MSRRLRARHADRHRSRGNDERNRERDGGEQLDAATAVGESPMGDGRRETDLPGQLCHGDGLIGYSRVASESESALPQKIAREFGRGL